MPSIQQRLERKLRIKCNNTLVLLCKMIETKKFKDKRRKQIYKSVRLTKEQEKEVQSFYKKHYGKKIPLIWHRHILAMTGVFDKTVIPEYIMVPEIEHYLNMWPDYCEALSDKNLFQKTLGVHTKMPELVLSCEKGFLKNSNNEWISSNQAIEILSSSGDLFIKPSIDTNSGIGCSIINVKNGVDTYSKESIEKLLKQYNGDFIVQRVVKCSDSIRKLYPNSVNTFRVTTYRWKDKIYYFPITMRLGMGGSNIDNAHAGGICVGIKDDGKLLKVAKTEFKKEYLQHPDTNVIFEDYQVLNFKRVIEDAKRMHTLIPQIGIIWWDYTIDENEDPVLIEANFFRGSNWSQQICHGTGVFEENTEEVLEWLKSIRKAKKKDIHKFAFGNIYGK